jgi:hypothetical protein
MRRTLTPVVFLLVALAPAVSLAQTEKATLRGTVTDPTGAVVPGAAVIVIEVATNVQARHFTTDANGNYEVPDLKPSTYQVKVDLDGFKSFVANAVLLDAGQVRRFDVRLEIGSTSEMITVEAGAAVIQTDTGTISGQFDTKRIAESPLVDVYPSPLALLTTTPGIQGNGWNLVMSGISDRNKQTWALDGVANDTTADQNDNPNWFETVQVAQVNPGADSARAVNFNMVSKHGANAFHGQGYYKREDSALNAKAFFDPVKTPYRLHETEFEQGGRIIADTTFFYFGWMYQSIPLGSFIQRNVPTAAMRSGDFSQFGTTIKNPYTGQPFANSQIPSSMFNPVSLAILNRYIPPPNQGGPAVLTNNYGFNHPFNNELYAGNWPYARVDHKLSANNTLYVRWMARKTPYIWPGTTPDLDWTQYRDHRQTVVSDTHVFGSSLVNSFTFGRSTDLLLQGEQQQTVTPLLGADVVNAIGLQGVNPHGYNTMGFPQIAINGGLSTLSSNQGGLTNNKTTEDGINTFQDTMTWSRGKHVVKVGAESRSFWQFQGAVSTQVYGNFSFDGRFTGSPFGDFLLGLPSNSTRLDPLVNRRATTRQHGVFVSDTLKPTSKLTLDYGLRWDYYGTPKWDDGLMYNWDPATGNVIVAPGTLSKINSLYPAGKIINGQRVTVVEGDVVPKANLKNFRPRASAAYRLDDRTVVRGGYGQYSETFSYFNRLNGAGPYQLSESYDNPRGTPLFSFPNPFPSSLALATVPGQSVTALPMQTDNGVIHEFNGTFEREVGRIGLRASYIGSRGVGLNYSLNINKPQASTIPFTVARRPLPQFVNTTVFRNDGSWHYDSLQLEAQRRFGTFAFDANYTYAHNVNNTSNLDDPYNVTSHWTNDGNDRRHYFVLSTRWEIAVGRGRRYLSGGSGVVDEVLGGWAVQTISTFASGKFYTPSFSGADPSNTNTVGGRPDVVHDPALSGSQQTYLTWFDPTAYAIPATGHFGNAEPNSLLGQGIDVHHLSLVKTFPLTGRVRMTFITQISDLFNRVHFDALNTNISNSNPGRFTSVVPNYNPEKQGFRQIDLKFRVEW